MHYYKYFMASGQGYMQALRDIFRDGSVSEKNMAITVFFDEVSQLTRVIKEEEAAIGSLRSLEKQLKKAKKIDDNDEEIRERTEAFQKAKSDKYSFADKRSILKNLKNSQTRLKGVLKKKIKR